jgi:hypothetical protein
MPTKDEQDNAIAEERQAAFLNRQEIKSGDFIRFPDGTLKRVAHVWKDENDKPESIQPTMYEAGRDWSFYLGEGWMSFSGSLNTGIAASHFRKTDELMQGTCWFFHHDYATAGGAVYYKINCRVWQCDTNER